MTLPPALARILARIRPAHIVFIVVMLYLGAVYAFNGRGVWEFIFPVRTEGKGYDGQFTYFIARDPLGAVELQQFQIDDPAYRYQRILHPVLARLLSLGNDALLPWVIVGIDVIMLVVGVMALERLLAAQGVNRWHALTYGLFAGVVAATRAGTTEPLAYGLVLLAILFGERGRLGFQAVFFALAALAKEPTLFFAAGYILAYLSQRRGRDAFHLGVIAFVPFALWQVVLYFWLGRFGIGSGGAGATGFEIIPFNGIWRIAAESLPVFLYFAPYLIIGVVIPTIYALIASGVDLLQRRWQPYVILVFLNAALILTVPFSTFREPFGIIRFLPGLVISFLLYAALCAQWGRSRRPLRYAPLWILWGMVLFG